MYNIGIVKDGKQTFVDESDGKPRGYGSLAEAVLSAQGLELTKEDVELHFVREGTGICVLSSTADSNQGSGEISEDQFWDFEKAHRFEELFLAKSVARGLYPAENFTLEKFSKDQLYSYASAKGIPVSPNSKKPAILAVIQEAEKKAAEGGSVGAVGPTAASQDASGYIGGGGGTHGTGATGQSE